VERITINSNGTYEFLKGVSQDQYTVQISTSLVSEGASAPSANIPSNWNYTRDEYGDYNTYGSTYDATADFIIQVQNEVRSNGLPRNVRNVNFGINQRPETQDVSISHPNPGGSTRVQCPTLEAIDNEDGSYGSGASFIIVTLPDPSEGTLYYNGSAVSAGQTISSYNPSLLTVDPTSNGADVISFTYNLEDNAGDQDATPATAEINVYTYTISGTVVNDANGGSSPSGSGIDEVDGQPLYVYLVNGSNTIVEARLLQADGSYELSQSDLNTTYQVLISTTQRSVGKSAPSSNLPSNWVVTGEVYGNNNNQGSGADATVDLSVAVSRTNGSSNVTALNFGLNKRPDSDDKASSEVNPGGTNRVTCPTLTGDDNEDGSYGSGDDFKIKTLPSNASLYYNGSAVSAGQTISNYNPSLLTVDPSFNGGGTIEFTYAWLDAGAYEDLSPATVTITISAYSLTGKVVNDADGSTSGLSGSALQSISGSQLYAYIYDGSNEIVAKATVASNGSFTFGEVGSGSYSLRLSTTNSSVGSTVPATNFGTDWVSVGEDYGTNNSVGSGIDASANGTVDVEANSADISNVIFALNKLPDTDDKSDEVSNPGGTATATVVTLTGSDDEDGTLSLGETFIISSLPSNATLYYNGSAVTAGQQISNYNNSLLKIDPSFSGYGISTFTVASVDAASKEDPSPATITITFSAIYVSGIVYQDGDGLTDNQVDGTPIQSVEGNQLYAYLISGSTVYEKATVQSDGSYRFLKADFNASYTVRISTISVNEGASAPSSSGLPSNWKNTGDTYGTNNSAGSGNESGIPDAYITVNSTSFDIESISFGAEPAPDAHNKTYYEADLSHAASSGHATWPDKIRLNEATGNTDGVYSGATDQPGRLSGLDDDDGKYAGATGATTGLTLVLKILPAELLVYDNGSKAMIELVPNPTASDASYTYWNSSTSEYEIDNFDADNLYLYFDNEAIGSIEFDYAWKDAADVEGTQATYFIEMIEGGSPLPIELIEFDASVKGSDVELIWTTLTEINSAYFVIERSTDMTLFEEVESIQAAGNSLYQIDYSFVDEQLTDGIYYYRLKMVDIDGTFEYTEAIQVQIGLFDLELKAYPNPCVEGVTVNLISDGSNIDYRLLDAYGRTVKSWSSNDVEQYIEMNMLSAGIYYLSVQNSHHSKTIRIVKK
jgi:hypothetical protein